MGLRKRCHPLGPDLKVRLAGAAPGGGADDGTRQAGIAPRPRPAHERRGVGQGRLHRPKQRLLAAVADGDEDIAYEPVAADRLTGLPEKRCRKAASSRAASSAKGGATRSSRAASLISAVAAANLFQGQTARQSSQP